MSTPATPPAMPAMTREQRTLAWVKWGVYTSAASLVIAILAWAFPRVDAQGRAYVTTQALKEQAAK